MNKRKRKEENHFTKLTIVLKIKKKVKEVIEDTIPSLVGNR